MPVIFKIESNEYSYPQSWADVTLDSFLHFIKNIEPTKPARALQLAKLHDFIALVEEKELQMDILYQKDYDKAKQEAEQLQNGLTDAEYLAEYLPYKCRYVSHFCGIDAENELHPQEVEVLYNQINANLSSYPKADNTPIEHGGVEYTLPAVGMRGAIVGEFLAASQAEVMFEEIANNNLLALPDLLSILLRPKGEQFDTTIAKSRVPAFKKMTMDKVWKVYFFLQRLNGQSKNILAYFSQVEALHRLTTEKKATN